MNQSLPNSLPAPGDRSALKEMLVIAAPAVASMLSFSLMQFVDRLLSSKLIGPEALAAAGNGGIASWVPASVMMGLLGVINTYVSQNLGAGKPERGPAYAWAGLWLGLVVWLVVLLPYAMFFPDVQYVMRAALGLPGISEHVQSMEAIYGQTLLVGMIFTLSARTVGHYFYGMHKPWIVMVSTISGNVVNLVLSYCFIQFAKADSVSLAALFPDVFTIAPTESAARRALQGAALGTVFGTLVECLIPLGIFLSARYNNLYKTRSAWRPSLTHIKDIVRIGWPGGVMFGNEMVCWWIFMGGFVGSFDKGEPFAAHGPAGWITHQYMMLSFMPAVGISIAVTAIVGRCIGAKRHDLAQARTWLGVKITMVYMGLCAACFVFLGGPMARLFLSADLSPEQADRIVELATWMLVLSATFQLFDGLAITLSGALRGAGDTVVPGIATIFLSWGVIVGGGWFAVNHLRSLSSYGPYIAASAYVILLSLMLLWRFVTGKWKLIKVIDRSEGIVSEASTGGSPVLASDIGPPEIAMAPALDVPNLSQEPAAGSAAGHRSPGAGPSESP